MTQSILTMVIIARPDCDNSQTLSVKILLIENDR